MNRFAQHDQKCAASRGAYIAKLATLNRYVATAPPLMSLRLAAP